MKFNINTQLRYLNTQDSDPTYTDHLGVDPRCSYPQRHHGQSRDVHPRRLRFRPEARYSFTVWTSAGAASIVVASNIGWAIQQGPRDHRRLHRRSRQPIAGEHVPILHGNRPEHGRQLFRPGFTQGVWANGEPVKGLNYLAFLGNGLNTLSISANKIDTHLLWSGSVWWEPLGPYGEPGKARNMYDDYFATDDVRVRLGTAFTRSREDRFSNLDQSSPENTSLYNSDGVLTFSTGAFAPGVTVDQATYRMWAADAGIKWNGLAVNGQYFMRWLNDFEADGPLPLTSTFDHGAEISASYFVEPKKLMPYAADRGCAESSATPTSMAAG